MSTITSPAVLSTIAVTLAAPSNLADAEVLFQEAFEKVKQAKAVNGKLPPFFDKIVHARGIEDVNLALENEKAANAVWRERADDRWIKKSQNAAKNILQFKPIVDSWIGMSPKIGGPLWGSAAFILGIIKQWSDTEELLEKVKRRIEASMERFRQYSLPHIPPTGSLRTSLRQFYMYFIEFAADLQQQLAHRALPSIMRLAPASVQQVASKFNGSIDAFINDVDWAAMAQYIVDGKEYYQRAATRHTELMDKLNSISGGQTMPVSPSVVSTRAIGIPKLLSKNFTGRQQDLRKVRASLTRDPHDQTQTAIYGLPGAGKSQLCYRYAEAHHPKHRAPDSYDYIMFVNASTTVTIQHSLQYILSELEPNNNPQDGNMIDSHGFSRVLSRLQNWLLLFDDVRSLDILHSVLPIGDRGHILFSTRHRLIADQLMGSSRASDHAEAIEILPMSLSTATQLASTLTQCSGFEEDKTSAVATEVAQFARGLPFAIEQVVHDSVFSNRPIRQTLQIVRSKQALLEQKNPSSLHGHDSSITALVCQMTEDVKRRSPTADVLFGILTCLEPSSMPMSLLRRGRQKLSVYLEREDTFDRGQIRQWRSGDRTTIDEVYVPCQRQASHIQSKKHNKSVLWERLIGNRTRGDQLHASGLPRDNTGHDVALRSAFKEGTPLCRLFSDEALINDAIKILREAGLVRDIGHDTLWMHDLFSEVAQALYENESMVSRSTEVVVTSTLVYLAFPVPKHTSLDGRHQVLLRYLPHAIACHRYLSTMQILNDFSVGPELSHIIASTLRIQYGHTRDTSLGTEARLAEMDSARMQWISYLRHALLGYMACHRRLLSNKDITWQAVITTTKADAMEEAKQQRGYADFTSGFQRLGRTPFYRAIQTMSRLSELLIERPHQEGLDEAVTLLNYCTSWFEIILGRDHEETSIFRDKLLDTLFNAKRYREAYQVALAGLKAMLCWDEQNQRPGVNNLYENNIVYSRDAVSFCKWAGRCCLEFAEPERGMEAVLYFKIYLKFANIRGEEHFCQVIPMQRLALAYEKAGERVASIYWWGRAVLLALCIMVWEGAGYSDADPAVGALLGREDFLENHVKEYEDALRRMGPFTQEKLVLDQFLGEVDGRIRIWRRDRLMNGSPYEKLWYKQTPEEDGEPTNSIPIISWVSQGESNPIERSEMREEKQTT